MALEILEAPWSSLSEYARIPISFLVTEVLDIRPSRTDRSGPTLTPRVVAEPWVKDYDLGGGPGTWAERFEVTNWALLAAKEGESWVGGATIAWRTTGVDMLENRDDLAVLWDIRVAPDRRRQGTGAALFRAVESWAVSRGCNELIVETQNVNVPACRFYARMGCVLRAANPRTYPDHPDEVRLLWVRDLALVPREIPIEDSIDLHAFQPHEIRDVVVDYLNAARSRGFTEVRLIHGKGRGIQRESIRKLLATLDFVESFSDGGPGRGEWGATVVRLSTRP